MSQYFLRKKNLSKKHLLNSKHHEERVRSREKILTRMKKKLQETNILK